MLMKYPLNFMDISLFNEFTEDIFGFLQCFSDRFLQPLQGMESPMNFNKLQDMESSMNLQASVKIKWNVNEKLQNVILR